MRMPSFVAIARLLRGELTSPAYSSVIRFLGEQQSAGLIQVAHFNDNADMTLCIVLYSLYA